VLVLVAGESTAPSDEVEDDGCCCCVTAASCSEDNELENGGFRDGCVDCETAAI